MSMPDERFTTSRRVIMDDQSDFEDSMQFRLTYEGPLQATQRDPLDGNPPKHTENRHKIRRDFHVQLKKLWENQAQSQPRNGGRFLIHSGDNPRTGIEELAKHHAHYGFNFVPLVTDDLDLICGLDILFLRSGRPGSVLVWPGDIDNRLKTLFDSMRIPEAGEKYTDRTPDDDEKPFFCLLEDDKLLNRVNVETDDLLQPLNGKTTIDPADARLVITVSVRPFQMTPFNMRFG